MPIAHNRYSSSSYPKHAGPALFGLVRFWSRRWMHHGAEADAVVVDIAVLEAVDAAQRSDDTSVAAVAEQLGIDRSGASRMITRATHHRLLGKFPADDDQRRLQLDITAAGRALLRDARAWQTATFQELVADWPPDDAKRFATYLVRLADQVLNTKEQL